MCTVAERLRSAVGVNDVCARLGGDEFAVVLRDVEGTDMLKSIADRLVKSVALPIEYEGDCDLHVTASVGVAVGSARYESAIALTKDADKALYVVKDRGRDGYFLYERYPQPEPVLNIF